MSKSNISIIGTGNVGGALGRRFVQSGFTVRFGVRPGKDITPLLRELGDKAASSPPAEAASWGDVVFLAVPGSNAVEAAKGLGEMPGKVLVDCTNPLRWDDGPVWTPPPEGSLTAAIAAVLPRAKVLKGFNTFGAEFHADPKIAGTSADTFLAGDDAEAKQTVAKIAEQSGFTAIDAGPLRNAAVLENLAMLWIHLATVGGHGRTVAFKLLRRG